jgi:hypothetical protein
MDLQHPVVIDPLQQEVPGAGAVRFNWVYDEGKEHLLRLYQLGKKKQWDAAQRINWDVEVDPTNAAGLQLEFQPLVGCPAWERLSTDEQHEFGVHQSSWLFSQFLHGEQGALAVAARIVESVPDTDSKLYAATQVIDEARHMELFHQFLRDKVGLMYPVNPDLFGLLESALNDGRWDLPYLAMQVLIEGVALAAFGMLRDMATNPLVKQMMSYVMQDEARHVAFGRVALRNYYRELTSAERAEREEFVIEGSNGMRERFRGREVYENLGLPVKECIEWADNSDLNKLYVSLLFSRIVPCVRDIGLWSEKVQHAYEVLGVLDAAKVDLTDLMRRDEEIAEEYDRDVAARVGEVNATIAAGSED